MNGSNAAPKNAATPITVLEYLLSITPLTISIIPANAIRGGII